MSSPYTNDPLSVVVVTAPTQLTGYRPRVAALVPVRCPHCGSTFDFDPAKETVVTRPVAGQSSDYFPAALTFRPTCPGCDRHVTVRIRRDHA